MNKRKSISVIALLFVTLLTGIIVYNTIAKYTSEVEKTGTATVASWNFEGDNDSSTFNFDITSTVNADTLVANKIAPGTSGEFTIIVKNTSDVGADVTIALGEISNKPENLKFYKTKSGSTYSDELAPGTGSVNGKLKANNASGEVEVTIYWNWAYETKSLVEGVETVTGDGDDTTVGESANELTIPVTVTGTQLNPAEAVSKWGF